jgi:hypothetical protein
MMLCLPLQKPTGHGIFMDSVLAFYRRRMRAEGIRDGRCGAIIVVQRNHADLKLEPHAHANFVDAGRGCRPSRTL